MRATAGVACMDRMRGRQAAARIERPGHSAPRQATDHHGTFPWAKQPGEQLFIQHASSRAGPPAMHSEQTGRPPEPSPRAPLAAQERQRRTQITVQILRPLTTPAKAAFIRRQAITESADNLLRARTQITCRPGPPADLQASQGYSSSPPNRVATSFFRLAPV